MNLFKTQTLKISYDLSDDDNIEREMEEKNTH